MRRTVWMSTVAMGLTGLLLLPPAQAIAAPDAADAGRQSSRTGERIGNRQPTIVPLSADRQISRASVTSAGQRQVQQETGRLYRDSMGRTREETGSTVTITDPTTNTKLQLDVSNQTFRRSTGKPAVNQAPGRTSTEGGQLVSTRRDLGTAQVNGVSAEGQAYTVTTPATKTAPARQKEVTLWLSKQVQLTVQTRITDATGYEYTEAYTNIRSGVEPDSGLFKLPAGYRDASTVNTSPRSTAATCPVTNVPDPLLLTSFDYVYLDYGFVTSLTDLAISCSFVADGFFYQWPLSGVPWVPLGLDFDQWLIYDNGGGPLPYWPYVALGDVVFVAANGSDRTTKDSLVVLTVWPCC